jgi:hypothetical protein
MDFDFAFGFFAYLIELTGLSGEVTEGGRGLNTTTTRPIGG